MCCRVERRIRSLATVVFSTIVLSVAAGCTAPAPETAPASTEPPDPAAMLASMKVVDLSYTYDEDTVYWPTSPTAFEFQTLAHGHTDGGFFYAANSFCTPEHGGTHLDAPIHFAEDRWTTEQIPVERLIGPGVVIDVAAKAAADPDYRLTAADVEAWEAENGTVPEGAIVLLRTGWGKHWPDAARYLGDDTPGDASNLHFPSYGGDSAELLVNQRQAAVLGVDTASIDYGASTDFIVHQIANGANVPGLENLANLDQLPPTGALIFALPMKIGGGSGGPLRAVALLAGN